MDDDAVRVRDAHRFFHTSIKRCCVPVVDALSNGGDDLAESVAPLALQGGHDSLAFSFNSVELLD